MIEMRTGRAQINMLRADTKNHIMITGMATPKAILRRRIETNTISKINRPLAHMNMTTGTAPTGNLDHTQNTALQVIQMGRDRRNIKDRSLLPFKRDLGVRITLHHVHLL